MWRERREVSVNLVDLAEPLAQRVDVVRAVLVESSAAKSQLIPPAEVVFGLAIFQSSSTLACWNLPIQPSARSCRTWSRAGVKRYSKFIMAVTRASAAALRLVNSWLASIAIGFSASTCLPDASARMTRG